MVPDQGAGRNRLPGSCSDQPGVVRLHPNEQDRLDSLYSYEVLDTMPDPAIDGLTRLAARVCRTPFAAVGLVDSDRHWFKSAVGLPRTSLTRAYSICSDAVATGELLVIADARTSPRYADNPQVTTGIRVRGYAAAPLMGRDGLPIGALFVADNRPRRFTAEQRELLTSLAAQVVVVLEEHRRDRVAGIFDERVIRDARDPRRLRHALEAGELVPYYQPVVDVVSGVPHGLEALMRWEHPDLGTLLPAAFLPAIEGTALVVPVGREILDAALRELASLHHRRLPVPDGMAVNVASGQLMRPGFADDVFAALDRHHIKASDLALEITETTAFSKPELALSELAVLANAGVQLVLDDYGVGWSNVARLLQLPVSTVKLDRSLVVAMEKDPRAAFIVSATVSAARKLDVKVIAEGVETEQSRRRVAATGCRWAQGWLFSPAVPAATLPRLLRRDHPTSQLGDGLRSVPHAS